MRQNLKLKLMTAALLVVATSSAAEAERWRNPTIYSIGELEAHTEFTSYLNRTDALQPLNIENPWHSEFYLSLNGEWDFNWYGSVDAVPEDWAAVESSVKKWAKMPVPGAWQSNGFDQLYYNNTKIGFIYDGIADSISEPFKPENIEKSKATGFIPDGEQSVGIYRKVVDIPADRLTESVILRIGSVEAAVEVYVNGQEVGYSQDSFLPAEFDIAGYLKAGENTIALKVYRWSDGSYMEVQDMIRWSGIYRDVLLKFKPTLSVRDIQFVGTPDKSLKSVEAIYKVEISNSAAAKSKGGKIDFELLEEGSTTPVKSWSQPLGQIGGKDQITLNGTLCLEGMKLWSPDRPNLYTLIATLSDKGGNVCEVVRSDCGFRRFEHIEGNYFLNGQRFFIKGVNRHDCHPVYGHYVPYECMIRDAELMKQNNINTVRTSHYPNDERWYYICNRYGIAMIDEANVECHDFEDVPDSRPEWIPAAVDRVENMVRRDINNPAILIWSLGNEQGWGWSEAFDQQYDRAKELDPSRYVMCDRGSRLNNRGESPNELNSEKPDAITPMYRSRTYIPKYLENREKNGERRPFFMCEYSHAMGNSVGALKEKWELFYANEQNGVNGGCVWDWVDQGVEAYDEKGRLYYQYGGDWGDKISNKNFCLNGLILSDRVSTPKLLEVKKCYEPFIVEAISLDEGLFSVKNRLNQSSLCGFDAAWELMENGQVIRSGKIAPLKAAPQQSVRFSVPYDLSKMCEKKEYFLRLSFSLKEDAMWAKSGHEITFSEFKLKGKYSYDYRPSEIAPKLTESGDRITVSTTNHIALGFDKASGALISLKVKDRELMAESPRDRLFDNTQAWIDNLRRCTTEAILMPRYRSLDLEHITREGDAKIKITKGKTAVTITIENLYMSPKKAGYRETQSWQIDGLGQIAMSVKVSPEGELKDED
ncbi:MAG: glycoside hydrolase family 2 TIM barrel-domain containing protein, partial [Rikenellaceae bacterium]